ncbi:hypothetical protein L1887_19641 [Cichorium endivia]|nr:hypothetical protein L1887_19641 [Cichorium endivia]
MDVRNRDEVVLRMKAAVASKQYGHEAVLCPLIADACIQVCPKNPVNFNVYNVRVAKLVGGGLHNYTTVRGMVLKGDIVRSIKKIEKAKLESYAKTEEAKVEELIKAVAESGAKVIASGASVGEMALHFCERYNLQVILIP